MRIYKLGTSDSTRYAYASGYRPFDGMSFFDDFTEQLRTRRSQFWALDPGEPGISVGDSGSCWPDVLYCGLHDPSLFFSHKVVESLDSHGVPLKRITPIPIGEIASKKLKAIPPPKYFVLEALPGIRVDYAASGFKVGVDGNPDLNAPRVTPPLIPQYDPTTWSGAEVFCQANGHGGPRYLDILCTERIKEIAQRDGWSNVSFNRVRVKGVNPFTGLTD